MKQALCVLLLASGCYDDRYRCTEHNQCDLGEGGRCEVDGYCTFYDSRCPTLRRYAAHAGSLTDQCFDDRVEPVNACAGGQPPARPEGDCYAAVCERLEACCEVAWLDACVQIAQETPACNLSCDTRLAITAVRGTTSERWAVRWSNNQWQTPEARNDLTALSWVAPAPGEPEPRLSGATLDALVIGERSIPIETGRTYHSITSIGFDRDLRDTIAASYSTTEGNRIELWKLQKQATSRTLGAPASLALSWGDADRDTYPDAIVWNGAGAFNFLYNVQDDESFDHSLFNRGPGNFAGGNTPGAPQQRAFDWVDINGDGELDMLMFGAEVRMHTNEDGLGDIAALQIDCDPPNRARPCATETNEPNLEAASFAGIGVPAKTGLFAVISMYPGRKVWRVAPDGSLTSMPFDNDGCSCIKNCNNMCPGPNCTCSYNCNSCVPILAFAARDLDADHELDIIAIDARLVLYTAKASDGYSWSTGTPIPTMFTSTFFSVDVSVSGATP
ncbi:MAG TPA: hypothetical protein VIV11_11715 [Kofleriaceae bacterium]